MSNIIDKIRISGITYDIQGGGGGIPESAFTAYTAATDARIAEDEEVTASGLNDLNSRINTVSGDVASKASQSAVDELNGVVTAHTANANIHVTTEDKEYWNAKAGMDEDLERWIGEQGYTKKDDDLWQWIYNEGFVSQGDIEETLYNYVQTSAITSAVTSASTNSQIPSAKAVYDVIQEGGGGGTVDQTIISGSTNAVAGGAVYDKFDEVEQVTAAALNNINDRLTEDEEVTAAGLNALNDKFDGLKLKKLTQAAYDALTTKDPSTLYIIVN